MATANANTGQPIIIKKKKAAHGHHGGAWKVALADFMTAMMAFFLLMWLLGSTSKEEREAISGYFNDPSGSLAGKGGGLDAPGVGMVGPGGANTGIIDMNNPQTQVLHKDEPIAPDIKNASDEQLKKETASREKKDLDALQKQLEEALKKDDSAFIKLKDQIIIDQTGLGLRIQIVDKENRPMFDLGSAELQVYAEEAMYALAPYLNQVPNKLSVNGHTDSLAFAAGAEFTNWELSANRANSARRALEEGGVPDAKMLTVQGLGAAVPRVEDKPDDPTNRRIVIMVLKKEVEEAMRGGSHVDQEGFKEITKQAEPPVVEPPATETPAAEGSGPDTKAPTIPAAESPPGG